MTELETPAEESATRRPFTRVVGGLSLAAVLFALVLAGPLYLLLSQDRPTANDPNHPNNSAPRQPTMAEFGGTPVNISTLDGNLAALYRGAKAHGRHFEQIPCFCGCDKTRLQHRHLLDCFLLKDGGGWESHATGCSVCQGEARMALELLDKGVDPNEVRELVIDEFGMPESMREMLEETT